MPMTPEPQSEQVQIFRATATPEDFRKANIGDWIQGVGEIQTEFEKRFIRNFGAMAASRPLTSAEQVLKEIEKLPTHINKYESFSIPFVYKYEIDKMIEEYRQERKA